MARQCRAAPAEFAAEYGPDPEEILLPPDATSLDFLQAVYRDPRQLMARRLRAATVAIPFEHPKLSVGTNFNSGFAARMERRMESIGMRRMLDAPLLKPADCGMRDPERSGDVG
jgi:hypothetical protein